MKAFRSDDYSTALKYLFAFRLLNKERVMAADGAGRRYHSPDQQVSLSVMGSHTHPEEFLDNFWQKELSTRGETVTYKFKRDNYYVI